MEKLKQFKESKGKYLYKELGVKEWAFSKENAIIYLELMKQEKIPCLGGDVVAEEANGELRYVDSNWYYMKSEDDISQDIYVSNSISKAKDYIENFQSNDNKTYYYVIV